jgi:nucleoside phosphorylase
VIETIFVPRGAEENAVRAGLGRSGGSIRVIATGIGERAAARAAAAAIAGGSVGSVLVTGLCGLLSPAFAVGDALVYRDIRRADGEPLPLDARLTKALASRIPDSQSGVRAVTSETVLVTAQAKAALAERYGAGAVDMESFAMVERLQQAGVSVAVMRIGSDASTDDLPALDRALDGSGGVDPTALALAMVRRPLLGARLALNGIRALAALRRAIAAIAAG